MGVAGNYTQTLDAVLKHDTKRIAKLISCVGYTASSAVQLEAIRLTQFLAARQPALADILVHQRLRQGGLRTWPPPLQDHSSADHDWSTFP